MFRFRLINAFWSHVLVALLAAGTQAQGHENRRAEEVGIAAVRFVHGKFLRGADSVTFFGIVPTDVEKASLSATGIRPFDWQPECGTQIAQSKARATCALRFADAFVELLRIRAEGEARSIATILFYSRSDALQSEPHWVEIDIEVDLVGGKWHAARSGRIRTP